ncbi:MAG: phosphatase PAP2 family protein [Chloroflexota bacterium]
MRTRRGSFTPLLAVGGIGLVVALALLVSTGLSDPFDAGVIGAVRSPGLSGLLAPLRQISELGSTWAVAVVAVVTLGLALTIGPWRHGVAGALTMVLASILNGSIKLAIARERLELLIEERGFSFPSGHAALAMVAYGILAVVIGRSRLPRAVRAALIGALLLLVLLIGLSRIWLGVHYPTDVVAGWTAGAVIVLLYRWFTRPVSREPAEAAALDTNAPPV